MKSDNVEYGVFEGGRVYTQESYEAEHRSKLETLYQFFISRRDQWVAYRANTGVESRWRANTKMYYSDQDGQADRLVETLTMGQRQNVRGQPTRSRVVVNIVRPKCDQAIARMTEILLPVDDRNWSIQPTPKPELSDRLGDERPTYTLDPQTGEERPTGMTGDQEAKYLMSIAKKRCDKMQKQIDDNLNECGYNGEQRKVIRDGTILGTGVIKGPVPSEKKKKTWSQIDENVFQMEFQESLDPKSEAVSPWNVFFDPAAGSDPRKGCGVFERVPNVTKRELRDLAALPGYDAEAIRQVLEELPKRVMVAGNRVTRSLGDDGSFEMWIYHGDIDPDEMSLLSRDLYQDPLEHCDFGVLVVVNDKIIGALKSWVPDKTIPYDKWNWREAEDSPYGYGLPDELAHQQRVIDSAWRQVMDNGRYSMGGQIVMRKNKVVPADGNWEITPGKLWYAKDDVDKVQDAFGIYEFSSHVEELMVVVEASMRLADVETSMPQILGGDTTNSPDTVGGQVLQHNNATSTLRYRVKLYDDDVTRPHISRYYDFHMSYNPDAKIKGDYSVDARGSSALVERDLQNQAMINLSAITNNPRYMPHMKERKELEAILKAFKLDPEELMKTEEEFKEEQKLRAEQGEPQDPRIQAAQINAQVKQMEIEDRKVERQYDREQQAAEFQLKREQLFYNMDREEKEFALGSQEAELTRELEITKLLRDGEMTREQQLAKERLERVKIADQRERFNAEMYAKMKLGTGI